jgi:plasmid maintenance system antidote protein VapI
MAPKHALIDFLKREYEIPSDRALSAALGITPPAISKIRSRTTGVSAEMIILIHKKTGMSIEDIEDLINESEEDK